MNHRSLRASPAGSTAWWRHCSSRLVLVKVPAFSVWRGGREEEHLGADVGGAHLAGLDLRAVLPEGGALDQRLRSRTTSQSRLAMPRRCSRALAEPTAGFSPNRK